MTRRLLFAILLILLLFKTVAIANSDSASISGRITDETGQEIGNVEVVVTNVQTGVGVSTLTNTDGIYVVGDLQPGPYQMTVEKEGFRRIVLKDLILNVQDVLGRNFAMQMGIVSESITIKAGAEENLSPAVSTVVDQQFVDNMPLNGRSFQSLIQLTPGIVVTPATQGMEGQFSVNGQRSNTNYFTVDGVSANFSTNTSVNPGQNLGGSLPALTISGGTNSFVSVDAMQEFRIQTSTYDAEFGRSPGGQISIVTKSGTNQFHGTAYDYVRNDVFDARNYFNQPPLPKPPLSQNDFGGTLGGPVLKNRTFFFFSYEGLRLQQPQTASADFYTQDARAAVAPVYQPLINAFPIPNGALIDPTCDDITNPCMASLTKSYSVPTTFDAYSLRLDHTLKRGVTVFARFSHTPSMQQLRGFSSVETDSLNTDAVTAGATVSLSPTKLNEFRGSWGRSTGKAVLTQDSFGGAVPPPFSAVFRPGDSFGGNLDGFFDELTGQSVELGTRVANTQRQLNFVDTFSMISGTHQLKVGADYRRLDPTSRGTNGYALFSTDFSQLRSGTMGLVIVLASDGISLKLNNWSSFAQDSWKATPRLSLTYGLRWEINTPPVSTTAGKPLYAIQGIFDASPIQLAPPGTPLWATRYNNVAPRFGATYQISSKTVLRGGTGLFYDLGYSGLLGELIFGFPYFRSNLTLAFGQPFDLDSPILQPPPFSTSFSSITQDNIAAFDPNLRLPLALHWNAAVERELTSSQWLSLTYLGANGDRLLRPDFAVPPELVGKASISATRNAGYSHYNAFQAQFKRRMSRGLQALLSYSLSKSSDLESDDIGGNFGGAGLNANSAPSLSQIQLPPLAPSDFDIRQSFSAAVSYEIPALSRSRAGHAALRDWAVDSIVRASSDPPLNVRIGGFSPDLGEYATQPEIVPGQPFWLAAPGEPGGKILNPNAFTLPTEGTLGNFPRNSLRSPFAISQTDIALRRRFHLTEQVTLDMRVEYFNMFNHPMFGGPDAPFSFWGYCTGQPCTGQQFSYFGKVLPEAGTLNEGLGGGGGNNGGQSAIYATGGSRSGQFSIKLQF